MDKTKFTSAPWIVKGDWMITDSNDRLIAQFEPLNNELSNSNTPESFANAHLISAAPDMYEMLSDLYKSLFVDLTTDNLPSCSELSAVLLKARGGE